MKVELELHEEIYQNIKNAADKMGMTVQEMIKGTLGERFQITPKSYVPVPLGPTEEEKEDGILTQKLYQIIMLRQVKCDNCMTSVSKRAILDNRCDQCGEAILK